ncbi:phage tail tape measure protein [Clostridium paraputrificum]|uniref:phage tail tape measure protein n=1 Tax=Clostridium paraputrificum TaxID=29363 RepID=UPI00189EA33D|nr:phage tail tape measure protein [Clostridium paraputrificum]
MAKGRNVNIEIQFESKTSVAKKLNELLKEVQKSSKIKLDLDTTDVTKSLNQLSSELNKVQKQLINTFNANTYLQKNINKINQATSAYNKQADAIKNVDNISKNQQIFVKNKDGAVELIKDVTTLNNGLTKTKTIAIDVKTGMSKITESINFEAFENKIQSMKDKLSTISENGFVDSSVINKLQQQLNSINTDTPVVEIKELENTIKNLSSSDSQIVRVQNEIYKMTSNLEGMKSKYGSLVGDKDSKAQLIAYENELNNLKKTLQDLNNGKTFSGTKITSELNKASNASRELKNSVTASSNALKLSQKDAISFGDAMKRSLQNVGIYASSAMIVREMVQELKQASEYIIEIDKRMTNMQMITGMSRDQVSSITNDFKTIGAELHTTNKDMMAGAEELLRAGYSIEEAKQMMSASILGSKISGQDTGQTSEQLIAIKNAFKMTGDEIEHVIDVITRLDNTSATSVTEITEAVKRTAYSAQQAGTDFDTLATYITTVSETTRKSADTIGESFKSMYSRYSNIKLGNLDEDGKSINDLETALKRIGLELRDSSGQFKDFDDVLQDVYKHMQITGKTTKDIDIRAITQALGGTRQKETVLALLENMELVKQHQDDIANSAGNAKRMFDEAYSDSLDAKINDLQRSFEEFYESILSSDTLGGGIELLTSLINTFGNLDSIIAITITTLALFKGQAILGLFQPIAQATMGMTGLSKAIGLVNLASSKLLTFGLTNPIGALAIIATTMITGFKALENQIDKTKQELQDFTSNAVSSFEESNKSIVTAEKLLKEKQSLEEQIAQADTEGRNNLELKEKLLDVERQLSDALPQTTTGYDEQGNAISSNTKIIQAEIDAKKAKLKQEALEVLSKNKEVKASKESYEAIKQNIEAMDLARKKGEKFVNGGWNTVDIDGNISTGTGKIEASDREYDIQTKKLQEYETALTTTRLAILQLKDMGVSNEEIAIKLDVPVDEVEEYSQALIENKDKANDNSSSQQGLADSLNDVSNNADDTTSSIKALSGEFDTLSGEIGIIDQLVEDVKKYGGVQESTMSSILSKYPELLSYYTNEGWNLQELANRQNDLRNQRNTTMQQAIACVNGEISAETKGANTKLKVHRDFVNQVLNDQTKWANLMADIYDVDTRNYLNALKAKTDALKQDLNSMASVGTEFTDPQFLRKLQLLEDYERRISYTISSNRGYTTPKISAPTITSGKVGNGSSSGNKKTEVEDLDLLINRYYMLDNVINNLNSTLEIYKSKLELATGKEYVNILNKELDIYRQQQQAIKNKEAEMKREQSEIKKLLQQNGFYFDSIGNVTNATKRLQQLEAQANAKSGESKKKAIEQVENIQKALENYASLTFESIPEMEKEWQNLANSIRGIKKEMTQLVADQESKYAELIKYNLQKLVDEETKALNDLKNKMNKIWSTEDYQDELDEKQNDLSDLYAQMQEALRSGNTMLAENLRKEYEEAQKELNKLIQQQDRNDFTEKIDDKITSLDEALQEALKPENINKLIEDAMKTGYVQIGNEIIKVQDAMNEYIKETTIGFQTAGNAMKDYIDDLGKLSEIIKSIDGVNADLGITIDKNFGNKNRILTEPSQLARVSTNTNNNNNITIQVNKPLVEVGSTSDMTKNEIVDLVDNRFDKFTDSVVDIIKHNS